MPYTLEDSEQCYNYLLEDINTALNPKDPIYKDNALYLLGKMHYCLLEERRKLRACLKEGVKPEQTITGNDIVIAYQKAQEASDKAE